MEIGRVGVWVSSRDMGGPHGRQVAAEIEQFGFGALWLGGADGDLALVGDLLDATQRIPVATGIVNVWMSPAAQVAQSFASVTAAHPGRFLLGLGIGHPQMVGARYERPYETLVSYLDALDAAGVPADGRVLAALGPKVLALAAARSAGAHPYLVTPEHTRRARAVLGVGPLLAPEQTVVLEPDATKARAIARGWLARYLTFTNYTANLKRLGFTDADLADGGSDALVDAVVAWGSVEAVAARVDEHLAAGADHVAVQVLSAEGRRTSYEALAVALA